MRYFTIGYRLPHFISAPLFGDREKFGLSVDRTDPCWKEWKTACFDFYRENQKGSIGQVVSNAGYRVMERVDLKGKKVLEIGPGEISHIDRWNGKPAEYVITEVREQMLEASASILEKHGIRCTSRLVKSEEGDELPFEESEFDVLVSFFALEHMYPFKPKLMEIVRVLKKGGLLVGAIPAEGGLAWGLGRFVSSRRWLKKNTSIDPDKIICWEHPNFAAGILAEFDDLLFRRHLRFWPFMLPSIDMNLVIRFVYEKR